MNKDEQMDFAINKISSYQNFTNRCFSKSHSLDQCNDDNIFFDKIDFSMDELIKNVSMEKGLVTILLKDNESIKYIPEIIDNNLLWKIECSSMDIANLCIAPNVIIKNNNKKNTNSITEINENINENDISDSQLKITNPLVINKKSENKENQIDKKLVIEKESLQNNKVHEIIKDVKTNDIIKTQKINEVNKTLKKIEESSKPQKTINNVEKSLNFNNLPDNVVVEKK